MATNDSMIQVKDLKKHYKMGTIRALDGVTVNINKGDVMAVIGPSGSGKSTFLRSLNCWRSRPVVPSFLAVWISPRRNIGMKMERP